MTKILHIATGQYVKFMSSYDYDIKYLKKVSLTTYVELFEDSVYSSSYLAYIPFKRFFAMLLFKHQNTHIEDIDSSTKEISALEFIVIKD